MGKGNKEGHINPEEISAYLRAVTNPKTPEDFVLFNEQRKRVGALEDEMRKGFPPPSDRLRGDIRGLTPGVEAVSGDSIAGDLVEGEDEEIATLSAWFREVSGLGSGEDQQPIPEDVQRRVLETVGQRIGFEVRKPDLNLGGAEVGRVAPHSVHELPLDVEVEI